MVDQHRPLHVCECPSCRQGTEPELASYHAAINGILPELHERSRRLFAGLLASDHGHGGIVSLAQITGLSRTTILRGLRELTWTAIACARRAPVSWPRAPPKSPRPPRPPS